MHKHQLSSVGLFLAVLFKTPLKILAIFLLVYLPIVALLSWALFFFLSWLGLGERDINDIHLELIHSQRSKLSFLESSSVVARIIGVIFVVSTAKYWAEFPIVSSVFRMADAIESKAKSYYGRQHLEYDESYPGGAASSTETDRIDTES